MGSSFAHEATPLATAARVKKPTNYEPDLSMGLLLTGQSCFNVNRSHGHRPSVPCCPGVEAENMYSFNVFVMFLFCVIIVNTDTISSPLHQSQSLSSTALST